MRGPAIRLCGGPVRSDADAMCVRHASVYGPWTYMPVLAEQCPLPEDPEQPHGDVEAPASEGGVAEPMTYWELTGADPND